MCVVKSVSKVILQKQAAHADISAIMPAVLILLTLFGPLILLTFLPSLSHFHNVFSPFDPF